MFRCAFTAALFAVTLGPAVRCRGDVFELKDGGQIAGAVVERTDDGSYVVRTADGAQLTLARNQLQRIVPQDETAIEYERLSRSTPDTADGHRGLVKWCREHKLEAEIDHHLQRVVDLDPEDDEARKSLGLQRVGDKWLSSDEIKILRGLKYFDGKWRTPQDIAIRQRNGAEGKGEANWHSKLRLWRGWLDSNRDDRVADAQANFSTLNDRQAVPALVRLLDSERDDATFELLLGTLGRIDDPLTVQTLVAYSLEYDGDNPRASEVRSSCIDYLLRFPRPAPILPYVQALKNKDNIIVNRAGKALGEIGDPAAISPLIDALVTRHKYQVTAGSAPGGISAGFDPSGSGGGGLSMGGNAPKFVEQDRENIAVLRALLKLSGGQNFDYDEQAWRHWYVDLQMRQHANARRDQ